MRKIIIFVFGLFFFSDAFGQANRNLNGSWEVNYLLTEKALKKEGRDQLSKMPDAKRNAIKKSFDGRIFKFSENNSIEINIPLQKNGVTTLNGKWVYKIISDSLSISIGNTTNFYKVNWLQDKKIELIFLNRLSGTLFNSLVLNRKD